MLPGPAAAQPRAHHIGAPAGRTGAPARRTGAPHHPAARAAATAPGTPRAAIAVALDPETGTLGPPTPAQSRQLSLAMRNGLLRTGAGLAAVRLPNGAMMIDLQGRYREFAIYRVGADGVGRFGCVHGADGVARALEDGAAPAAGMEWSDR
jgi:hypothetical protein